ncbi:MAG TPA: histidine phosphatase family protein [Solirubrobacterales bacterium]|nr:histidine phosphatase family protein [Solirubrobacterales bacterium]
MKRLYLLRHAKSSWDEPGLADRARPLAPRGRRASKLIAAYLRDERIAPDLVLCSPAKRTRQTLNRIELDAGEVRFEDELYAASAGQLLTIVNGIDDDVRSAMAIGHNPGLRDLALQLAGSGGDVGTMRAKFPTAALATLAFEGGWRELTPGGAELVAFVKPKQLAG